jgi:hypothetical protein
VEGRQRKLVVSLVALLLLASVPGARGHAAGIFAHAGLAQAGPAQASPSQAGPAQDGTASGQITVNAVTVPFAYAYARAQPGAFDKTTEDVRVLLSDVPLSETARGDVFELIALARADKAHIIEVLIDATGAPISGAIYAKAFDGMLSATGMHEFTRADFERTRISGKLGMSRPHTFTGVTWQYEATFSARIPRPPSAEEVAASLRSPPARAATAYIAAVRRGELRGFIAVLTSSLASEYYRHSDAAARLAQLRAEMPADTKVASVNEQPGGVYLVSIEGHQDGIVIAYTLRVVLEGSAWRIDK